MKFSDVTKACQEAMRSAKEAPGRYGGRYVARGPNEKLVVLPDDDPDTLPSEFDVLAQCTPDRVYPVGHARTWLNDDGSTRFS